MPKKNRIPLRLFCIAILMFSGACAQADQESREGEGEIQPFRHIYNIVPGESRQSAALKMLGDPRRVEITEIWEVAGVKGGGNKKLHYTDRGIFLLISSKNIDEPDPVIDAVWVEAPFKGRSANGLYLGMPRDEALRICRRDYHETDDLKESFLFARRPGEDSDFQIWFKNGKLMRMKIFGPLNRN